jgi:hypothetical protein
MQNVRIDGNQGTPGAAWQTAGDGFGGCGPRCMATLRLGKTSTVQLARSDRKLGSTPTMRGFSKGGLRWGLAVAARGGAPARDDDTAAGVRNRHRRAASEERSSGVACIAGVGEVRGAGRGGRGPNSIDAIAAVGRKRDGRAAQWGRRSGSARSTRQEARRREQARRHAVCERCPCVLRFLERVSCDVWVKGMIITSGIHYRNQLLCRVF